MLAEEDKEQHDVFFISHPAFITPLSVLGLLIRRYNEAFDCQEAECINVQTRQATFTLSSELAKPNYRT
jgi:hypothetical protein